MLSMSTPTARNKKQTTLGTNKNKGFTATTRRRSHDLLQSLLLDNLQLRQRSPPQAGREHKEQTSTQFNPLQACHTCQISPAPQLKTHSQTSLCVLQDGRRGL